jgi:hypothetical protein
MGGGSYSYISSSVRASKLSNCSANEIFSNSMSDDMNICGKVRESVDSNEHPFAFPVILGLDVTGSMGGIPYNLITKNLPNIMKKIQDNNIPDVQLCFTGIGDIYYDDAPFQAGQFESSDELMEKWLKELYIERGGGPNEHEDYELAWYFGAYHTKISSTSRGVKGVLITIGDEYFNNFKENPSDCNKINKIFGDTTEKYSAQDIYDNAAKSWNIYHINIEHGRLSGKIREQWEKQLGQNLISIKQSDGFDYSSPGTQIEDIIVRIVSDSWNAGNNKEMSKDDMIDYINSL